MTASPSRLTRVAFGLIPVAALLLSAEAVVRVKYFVQHHYETDYLTTPLLFHEFGTVREDIRKVRGVRAETTPKPSSSSTAGANEAGPAAGGGSAAPQVGAGAAVEPMVFRWPTPCVSGQVFSAELNRLMPRTWDANCFRGDRVSRSKEDGEFRIVFIGGSTVQDFQSDDEMMTAQFGNVVKSGRTGRVTVLNAGRSGFNSANILEDYTSRVGAFRPDAVLYYEAWNEQPHDLKPMARADAMVRAFGSAVHKALRYRSMLYTYLIEKYAFLQASKTNFFRLDATQVRRPFAALAQTARGQDARFVFVTQVVNFPRMWKGVDTYDYEAVDRLLVRMQADPQYDYDVQEISALNQRLTVAYTVALCRELDVPVINILEAVERLGAAQRAEMFMDLGHLTAKGDRIVGKLIADEFLALPSPR